MPDQTPAPLRLVQGGVYRNPVGVYTFAITPLNYCKDLAAVGLGSVMAVFGDIWLMSSDRAGLVRSLATPEFLASCGFRPAEYVAGAEVEALIEISGGPIEFGDDGFTVTT